MAAHPTSFRVLYRMLWEYQNRPKHADAYHDVLLPWRQQAIDTMSVLRIYGDINARHWRPNQPDPCNCGDRNYYSCLEHLYALSRISDVLLASQQRAWDYLHPPLWHWTPESVENHFDWMSDVGIPQWTSSVSLEERNAWLDSLGFTQFHQPTFHPFYHEIVEVEQSLDPDEPITLLEIIWPGYMLGQMMFCRAGVRVRSGERIARKDLAEHSHLYWTFVRRNRPTVDKSHGWGHNSQWGTNFRRDYVDDDGYFYNVDGDSDVKDESVEENMGDFGVPNDERDIQLTLPMRIELLTNRCFIRTPEPFYDQDLDWATYREPR